MPMARGQNRSSEQGLESPQAEHSLLGSFSASALDAGLQRPVNGVSQLAGRLVGKQLPELHLVDPVKPSTGAELYAQQAGAAVGMIVPFLISRAATRGALGGRLGESIASAAVEGGGTGFVMGGILSPVENERGFWSGRLSNAVTEAGTFAALSSSLRGLGGVRTFAVAPESTLWAKVSKGAVVGAIGGIPAGLASAELASLTHGNGLATTAELGKSVTGFAMFGGALGGAFGGVGGAGFRSRYPRADSVPLSIDLASPKPMALRVQESAARVEPSQLLRGPADAPAPAKVRLDDTKVAKAPPEKVIPVDKRSYLGEGDEGKVYSNNDGSVTKVFTDRSADMGTVKGLYERLQSIGVRTPKVLETGKTADGSPALRMEQIGDGDNLNFQLITGELTRADMVALRQQYYAFGDAITGGGIRIDWQLKNMRFQEGKLYILDPSFIKEEPMSPLTLNRYAQAIGPRP